MRIALSQDTLTVLADQGLRGTRAASTPSASSPVLAYGESRYYDKGSEALSVRGEPGCNGWAGGFRADKDQFLGLAQQPHLVVLHGDDVVEVGEVSRGQIQDLLLAGGQPGLKPGKPARLQLGQELGEAAEQLGTTTASCSSPAGSACGHRPLVPRVRRRRRWLARIMPVTWRAAPELVDRTKAILTGSARLLPRLIGGRTRGPLFLADRRPVPARAPATVDRCPETGRGRRSYGRAEALSREASGG